MDDDTEKKKAKGIKKCVIKRGLMFENYKDSMFNNKTILQTFNRVTTYPYGTNAFKVCESEMLSKISV